MPAPITITEIHARDPEYAEVTNRGAEPFDLSGHVLNAGDAGQDFTFPDGTVLAPGESVRVYTNKADLAAGEFSYGSATPIWNNEGDVARLKSPGGFQLASARFPRRPGSALLGGAARSPLNRGSLSGLGKLGQTSKPKPAEPPAAETPAAEAPAAAKPAAADEPAAAKPAAAGKPEPKPAAKPEPKPAAKPAATKPAAAEKPAAKPAATKHAVAEKPAPKPAASKPATEKPAPKPAASKPVPKPAAKPAAPKPAAARPAANPPAPIVVDMGRQRRGRVKRLRQGRGRLMSDLQQTLADLGEAGVLKAGAPTVIIVVERRSKANDWML